MDKETNLFNTNLIQANLIPADIVLHVLTKDKLENLNSTSVITDVLGLISSLAWGAFISCLITIGSIIGDSGSEGPVRLEIYKTVFLWASIVLTVFWAASKIYYYIQIRSISRNRLKVPEKDSKT